MVKLVVQTVTEDSLTLLCHCLFTLHERTTRLTHADFAPALASFPGVRLELHGQAGGHVSGHRPQPGVPGGLHSAPRQARHRDGRRYVCVCVVLVVVVVAVCYGVCAWTCQFTCDMGRLQMISWGNYTFGGHYAAVVTTDAWFTTSTLSCVLAAPSCTRVVTRTTSLLYRRQHRGAHPGADHGLLALSRRLQHPHHSRRGTPCYRDLTYDNYPAGRLLLLVCVLSVANAMTGW
jgi:hypothetical protein